MMNELRWEDLDAISTVKLAANLDASVRALYQQVCALSGACPLLRLLDSQANSVLTADDIAYYLKQVQSLVERNLDSLVELGWVRRVALPDCTWYGLTTDPQKRQLVHELFAWQDGWSARLEQLRHAINGLPAQS